MEQNFNDDLHTNYQLQLSDSSSEKSESIPSMLSRWEDVKNISPTSYRTTPDISYSPLQVELPPASLTSSGSCHGFQSVTSYSPDYPTKLCLDQRLEAYNHNAWDIVITEHVDIPPTKIAKFLIKVTLEFSPTIRYSLRYQNEFVLTSSLSPFPQINDGVYDTIQPVELI